MRLVRGAEHNAGGHEPDVVGRVFGAVSAEKKMFRKFPRLNEIRRAKTGHARSGN